MKPQLSSSLMLQPIIRAVGFDLDGTLVNSLPDIAACLNECLVEFGHSPLPPPIIRGYIGDGAKLLVARALELPVDAEAVSRLAPRFVQHYAANPARFTTFMPGAERALARLKELGLPIALCTNKPRPPTEALLTALGLKFASVVCGDDLSERKPHPAPLIKICTELNIPKENFLFIGDGPQDILAAKSAGAISVGVSGGISAAEPLIAAKPDYLLPSLSELPGLFSAGRLLASG